MLAQLKFNGQRVIVTGAGSGIGSDGGLTAHNGAPRFNG